MGLSDVVLRKEHKFFLGPVTGEKVCHQLCNCQLLCKDPALGCYIPKISKIIAAVWNLYIVYIFIVTILQQPSLA